MPKQKAVPNLSLMQLEYPQCVNKQTNKQTKGKTREGLEQFLRTELFLYLLFPLLLLYEGVFIVHTVGLLGEDLFYQICCKNCFTLFKLVFYCKCEQFESEIQILYSRYFI